MNNLSIGVLALVVGVIIGAATVKIQAPAAPLAGVTVEDETFVGPVTLNGTLTTNGTVTFNEEAVVEDQSGTTTLTILSNTAGKGGAISTYGTSSATRVCVEFMLATSTVAYAGKDGLVTWKYGACE